MDKMISIIVPIYKVEQYLDRCVNSIINQTYKHLEIILVDDGSPDNCGIMCDEYAKQDDRIKVIHKENGGLSDARNAGLDIAKGDYIGFVDSDDWIEKDMYEKLINLVHRFDTKIAVTGINRIYENGYNKNQFVRNTPIVINDTESIVKAYLLQESFSTAAWDKLYHRSLFEKRRFPKGKLYEDAPVIFDILCNINSIALLGSPDYHYFQRSNSICGQDFSINKMDHLFFSKEIMQKTKLLYPSLFDAADIFYCCKLCEICYTLDESDNSEVFIKEKRFLLDEIKNYKKTILNKGMPNLYKLKLALICMRLDKVYCFIKQKLVRKG